MSQNREIFTRDRNYYFDENTKIWYNEDDIAVTTLYLSSQYKLTRDEIISAFSCYGEVEDVRVIKKIKHSIGFVTFKHAASAAEAFSKKFLTISGHTTRVSFAENKRSKKKLSQKSTKDNATAFLSLNDDCIYEILLILDLKDLCSVAVTCVRLKDIAERIFKKTREVSIGPNLNDSRKHLVTFGSLIAVLRIDDDANDLSNKKKIRLLDLATRCCGDALDTLILKNIVIPKWLMVKLRPLFKKVKTLHIDDCTITGTDEEFFYSESLVELKVNENLGVDKYVLENTYHKLERLIFYGGDATDEQFEMFMKRHDFLKSLTLWCIHSVWPQFADDCKQLEELKIGFNCEQVDCNEFVKRISTLDRLRELNINLDDLDAENVTKCMKELKSLKSLQCLELNDAKVDSGFIPALLHLKHLQVLRLKTLSGLQNLRQLGDLKHLTELTLTTTDEKVEFDLVGMIKRLINLKILHFDMEDFKLNMKMYFRIVEVVRDRPISSQRFLEMTCVTFNNFKCDGNNCKVVNINKLSNA